MTIHEGAQIPKWAMERVDAQRMKTMAAILRDPYPVHWDRDANEAIGYGGQVINQGPLNLSYIANMLMAWQGPHCIRRLQVAFGRPVLDDDNVVATGIVDSIDEVDGERRATCTITLQRDGEDVVTGTAVVALSDE